MDKADIHRKQSHVYYQEAELEIRGDHSEIVDIPVPQNIAHHILLDYVFQKLPRVTLVTSIFRLLRLLFGHFFTNLINSPLNFRINMLLLLTDLRTRIRKL